MEQHTYTSAWNSKLCFGALNELCSQFDSKIVDEKTFSIQLVEYTNKKQQSYDWHFNYWWFNIKPRNYLDGVKLLLDWFNSDKISEQELSIALEEYDLNHNPYRALSLVKYGGPRYNPPQGRTALLGGLDFSCSDD